MVVRDFPVKHTGAPSPNAVFHILNFVFTYNCVLRKLFSPAPLSRYLSMRKIQNKRVHWEFDAKPIISKSPIFGLKKLSRRNFLFELLDDSCSGAKIWFALLTFHFFASICVRLPKLDRVISVHGHNKTLGSYLKVAIDHFYIFIWF